MAAIRGFIFGIFTLATVLVAGFAQAAEERITPPNPAEVAILRGLLALQHPALRHSAATVLPGPTAVPAVTTEPTQPQNAQPATEGEACVRPLGAASC